MAGAEQGHHSSSGLSGKGLKARERTANGAYNLTGNISPAGSRTRGASFSLRSFRDVYDLPPLSSANV